jgi:hypothetical protein
VVPVVVVVEAEAVVEAAEADLVEVAVVDSVADVEDSAAVVVLLVEEAVVDLVVVDLSDEKKIRIFFFSK